MKKYFIGIMILSAILMMNPQIVQARGNNGQVDVQQGVPMGNKKHPVAYSKRSGQQTTDTNYNVGSNRRLEGKEKAIERRLEGKQKAIERRLEGKEKLSQSSSQGLANVGQRTHRGHRGNRGLGRHRKKNLVQQRHTNRGDLLNSLNNVSDNLKQKKNKRYIKQNGIRNKFARRF